jgi:hypothetical protein
MIALLNLRNEKMEFTKGQPVCTFLYFRHEKQAALVSREERVYEIRTETDVTPGSPEEQVKFQDYLNSCS